MKKQCIYMYVYIYVCICIINIWANSVIIFFVYFFNSPRILIKRLIILKSDKCSNAQKCPTKLFNFDASS